MADLDLCYLPAHEALARFRAKTLSPVELMEAVIARAEAVKDPAVADKLLALGAEPVSSTPEQLDAFYRSEVARWAQVVRQARVTID